jgi:NAD-dependent SIR2 family protein deacetylase
MESVESRSPTRSEPERLSELVARGGVFVLTGAGVSTDSGIPDYRDERGDWKRRQPIQYREFIGSESARQRYWARSFLGFPRLSGARPNLAHHALRALEQRGLTRLLVTQNVDGLHQAAGSQDAVDLHGRIDRVVCLACRAESDRGVLQAELAALNPEWAERGAATAPDGDADPGDVDYASFRVAACPGCGGLLKPDVVFFGENVPRPRVDRALGALQEARSLLVVGSSLMVFSGYRFARAAAHLGIPIAVINRGRTRADTNAALKVEGNAGDVLTDIARRLAL